MEPILFGHQMQATRSSELRCTPSLVSMQNFNMNYDLVILPPLRVLIASSFFPIFRALNLVFFFNFLKTHF